MKKILFLILISLPFLLFKKSINYKFYSYEKMHQIKSNTNIIKKCYFNHGGMNLYSNDCRKVSKNEWHVKPCGVLSWCSIKDSSINISNKSIKCENNNTKLVTPFEYIALEAYYKYKDKKIKNCL